MNTSAAAAAGKARAEPATPEESDRSSTGQRSCQPQLTQPKTSDAGAPPRLRDFDEVAAEYNACLNYLAGTTTEPTPTLNNS